jgi:hypothetical protein
MVYSLSQKSKLKIKKGDSINLFNEAFNEDKLILVPNLFICIEILD